MTNKDLVTAIYLATATSLIEQCRDSRICPLVIQDMLQDALESLNKIKGNL